jgi:transposase
MTSCPSSIIGVDMANETFSASVFCTTPPSVKGVETWPNNDDGFAAFERSLQKQGLFPSNTLVCLENTGIYSEAICYWLAARGYLLAVEPPHKVRQALSDRHQKSDDLDSQQIAEYAFRFFDKLHIWKTPSEIQEQLSVLLATREQFSRQSSGHQSTLLQVQRKVVKTPLAEESLRNTIQHLKEQIKKIDQEIKRLISNHPSWRALLAHLTSIPGVGLLLATNLLILTKGFTITNNPRQIASHLGLSPCKFESGTSVYKKPRSRGYGHSRSRKLLYLAALSLRTHNQDFERYFLRKVQEGKSKRLVLNNISNRLLGIICAVARTQKDFINNYKSVNPMLLKA